MTYSFNLLDEEWIPCCTNDGNRRELNLIDAICQSHHAREIVHASALVTVAIHRLLLAILHRVFGPSDQHAWRGIWNKRYFDEVRLKQYLNQYKDRFGLFHEKHPFYQTSAVSFDYATSTAKLLHELASGHNPTLFDHTLMSTPPVLGAAEAARLVVALQAYALPGLVSFEQGRREADGSAESAFMVKGAAILVTGQNLFETLMLNLVQYNAEDEEPFAFDPEKDKPAWERDEDVKAMDRLPDGYLDWLTWQSRRIRLKPEIDGQGRVVVREAVIMKGFQLADRQWRYGRETMIAFRKNERATTKDEPWPALAFTENKALWRDTLSLFQSVGDEHARPKTVEWLADLKANGALSGAGTFQLSALGLCTHRARVDFWRHETLPLPSEYLSNRELVSGLKAALDVAEKASEILGQATWLLARLTLIPDESNEPGKEAKKEINLMCDNLAIGRPYWSGLETPFKQLLVDLPEDKSTDEYGSTVYGARCLPEWAVTIRRAAKEAFDTASAAVGESARSLRARAKAESVFRRRLNSILKPYTEHAEEGGEEV